MGKILTAFISLILTSLLISYYDYVPKESRQEGIYYYSYDYLFLQGTFVILPIFLVLGIPISLLTDSFLRRKVHSKHGITRYMAWLVGYLLAGFIVGTVLLLVLFNNNSNAQGIYNLYVNILLGSFIFFHVAIVVEPIVFRIKKRIINQLYN